MNHSFFRKLFPAAVVAFGASRVKPRVTVGGRRRRLWALPCFLAVLGVAAVANAQAQDGFSFPMQYPMDPPPVPEGLKSLALQYIVNAGVKRDGTVYCWGSYAEPYSCSELSRITSVALGGAGAAPSFNPQDPKPWFSGSQLALRSDGTIVNSGAWGNLFVGEPGNHSGVIAVAASPLSKGRQLLYSDGTIQFWTEDNPAAWSDKGPSCQSTHPVGIAVAENAFLGLCGDGTVTFWGDDVNLPAILKDVNPQATLKEVIDIAAADDHYVALKVDGTVVEWDSSGRSYTPPGINGVIAVAAGHGYTGYTMALRGDGTLYTWNWSASSQLTNYPIPLSGAGAVTIAAGFDFCDALVPNTSVLQWGTMPATQDLLSTKHSYVKQLANGDKHSVALTETGLVQAWGDNSYNQITVPVGLQSIKAVAAGAKHSLSLNSAGVITAWGDGSSGNLSVPTRAQGHTKSIAAGASHSVALTASGSVIVWGDNTYQQQTVPVNAQTGVKAIAAGGNNVVALKDDGTVVIWGQDTATVSGFKSSTSDGRVKAVAAGAHHVLLLLADGTVTGSGANNAGQLSIPPGLHDVVEIAAAQDQSLARLVDGTVVAWGANAAGQTTVPAGLNGVIGLSAGSTFSSAVYVERTDPLPNAPSLMIQSDAGSVPFTITGGTGCPAGNYVTPSSFTSWPASGCTATFQTQVAATQADTRLGLSGWTVQDPSSRSGGQTISLSPNSDTWSQLISKPGTYTASYDQPWYLVSTSVSPANAGSIVGGGWVSARSMISLVAKPASGFQFSSWQGVPASTALTSSNLISTIVTAPLTSVATFLQQADFSVAAVQCAPNSTVAFQVTLGHLGERLPAGQLAFSLNGSPIGTVSATGAGTYQVSSMVTLPPGTYPVTVTYSPSNPAWATGTASATLTVLSIQRQ